MTNPDVDIQVSQQNKLVPACIPARYGSACIFDDFIFITGGETLESGVPPILDDVLVYNIVTHQLLVSITFQFLIIKKCQIPSPETYISHHSSIIRNGRLMLFGGTLGWNRYNLAVMASITSLAQFIAFGTPLEDASKIVYYRPKMGEEHVNQEPRVPDIVNICVEYLLQHGVETKNIFNKNVPRDEIIRLRLHFEYGNIYDHTFLEQDADCTPDAVGQLLIEYFSCLPDALLTTNLYRSWLDAYTQNDDESIVLDIYRDLIEQLPPVNRVVLCRILHLLHAVATNNENGMSAAALSVTWSHTLLRTNVMSKYSVKDDFQDGKGMSPINYCVSWLMSNYSKLFK
jgi:hypothetical protein